MPTTTRLSSRRLKARPTPCAAASSSRVDGRWPWDPSRCATAGLSTGPRSRSARPPGQRGPAAGVPAARRVDGGERQGLRGGRRLRAHVLRDDGAMRPSGARGRRSAAGLPVRSGYGLPRARGVPGAGAAQRIEPRHLFLDRPPRCLRAGLPPHGATTVLAANMTPEHRTVRVADFGGEPSLDEIAGGAVVIAARDRPS